MAERTAVLIVDQLELRRSGFASVIEEWARAAALDIDEISPTQVESYAARQRSVAMVILSVGVGSLGDVEIRALSTRIGQIFSGKPCVLLSNRTEHQEAISAANLSMAGFLSTKLEKEAVHRILTFILGGGTYFPREALLQSAGARSKTEPGKLTRRQLNVLKLLRLGYSNKRIARDLKLQESTVKVDVRIIMTKLGAANRTQAALLAASFADGEVNGEPEEKTG